MKIATRWGWVLAVFLGLSGEAFAQMNYRPGIIVTTEGDTLEGWIRDQGTLKNLKSCKFKSERSGKPRIYFPPELRAYQATGYKHFQSMEWQVDSGYQQTFAEVLIEGKMELYQNWRTKNLAYVLRKENGDLMALQNEEFTYRKEGEGGSDYYAYGEKYEGFIKFYRDSMMTAFADQPTVVARVDGTEYRSKSLQATTRAYLVSKYGAEKGLSYEKNHRLTRDRFGFYVGAQTSKLFYLNTPVESDWVLSYPVGMFYAIPLSYFSERLYFQVEANYRYLNYDPLLMLPRPHTYRFIQSHVVGIPLLLHYRLSVKPFAPTLGAGKELGFNVDSYSEYHYIDEDSPDGDIIIDEYSVHRVNKGGWFAEIGFDWEQGNSMALFAKVRVQRYRNKIIPDGVENNVTFKVAEGDESWSNAFMLLVGLRF